MTTIELSKGLFTWRWGTPGRWGNPLWWGNPPVHIISHVNWSRLHDRWGDPPHVNLPFWGPSPPCKQALTLREQALHLEESRKATRKETPIRGAEKERKRLLAGYRCFLGRLKEVCRMAKSWFYNFPFYNAWYNIIQCSAETDSPWFLFKAFLLFKSTFWNL